ncbi:MAG: hypothetical protein U0797_22835 [Gemmataceae bacterium]
MFSLPPAPCMATTSGSGLPAFASSGTWTRTWSVAAPLTSDSQNWPGRPGP